MALVACTAAKRLPGSINFAHVVHRTLLHLHSCQLSTDGGLLSCGTRNNEREITTNNIFPRRMMMMTGGLPEFVIDESN